LHFDVPRPFDEALAEDAIVAEGSGRLALGSLESPVELESGAHDAHTAPAAACGSLDDEWKAEVGRIARRHHRDTRLPRDVLRRELVAADLVGPTKTRPAASTAAANEGLSARKP